VFSEGVRHFERQFQVDGDVARNRSMDRWIEEWCSYNFAAGSFHTKKLCSRLFSREVEFYWHKQRYRVFVPPFEIHLWLVGKRVVDFLWVLIELFSLAITVEALWADIGRNFAVWKGVGQFERKFQGKRGVPHNDFWHQKTRVPGLSYGEKIAKNFNRLSRAHQRHRQTDRRQTEQR